MSNPTPFSPNKVPIPGDPTAATTEGIALIQAQQSEAASLRLLQIVQASHVAKAGGAGGIKRVKRERETKEGKQEAENISFTLSTTLSGSASTTQPNMFTAPSRQNQDVPKMAGDDIETDAKEEAREHDVNGTAASSIFAGPNLLGSSGSSSSSQTPPVPAAILAAATNFSVGSLTVNISPSEGITVQWGGARLLILTQVRDAAGKKTAPNIMFNLGSLDAANLGTERYKLYPGRVQSAKCSFVSVVSACATLVPEGPSIVAYAASNTTTIELVGSRIRCKGNFVMAGPLLPPSIVIAGDVSGVRGVPAPLRLSASHPSRILAYGMVVPPQSKKKSKTRKCIEEFTFAACPVWFYMRDVSFGSLARIPLLTVNDTTGEFTVDERLGGVLYCGPRTAAYERLLCSFFAIGYALARPNRPAEFLVRFDMHRKPTTNIPAIVFPDLADDHLAAYYDRISTTSVSSVTVDMQSLTLF